MENRTGSTRRRRVTPHPTAAASSNPEHGLKDEINMVRTVIRRVMALTENGHSLSDLLKVLDTLSKASGRLANLLKTERVLNEDLDVVQALKQALADVLDELESESRQQSQG